MKLLNNEKEVIMTFLQKNNTKKATKLVKRTSLGETNKVSAQDFITCNLIIKKFDKREDDVDCNNVVDDALKALSIGKYKKEKRTFIKIIKDSFKQKKFIHLQYT